MEKSPLNPMVFHKGFLHITEQIFEKLDNKSLKNCREISKTWQVAIDNRNILWKRFAKKNGGTKSFQLACETGHFKMASMLIQNTIKFKIDLNAKNRWNDTAFHLACKNRQLKIAKILIQKSAQCDIDLNAKDNFGNTAFHWACKNDKFRIANILIKKFGQFNIDLNTKDLIGKAAYGFACFDEKNAEMIENNAKSFKNDL